MKTEMQPERTAANWYTRICIVVFLVFLGGLVYCSFSFGSPPYQITTSILFTLSLMAVSILADSFSSISFGTIFHLKKEVARAEVEKKEARDETRELRSSLVTLATTMHQSQVTTNISGLDIATLRRALGVVEASPEEKERAEEDVKEATAQDELPPSRTSPPMEETWEFRRAFREVLEDELFRRFVDKYKVPPLELRREVRFDSGLENIDPIMSRNIIYDGYVHTDQKEYFIRASPLWVGPSMMYADRLYVALAKVLFYRQVKKVDAELVFLDAALPENIGRGDPKRSRERLLEWFQPAIAGGLLRVETFILLPDEYKTLKDAAKKKMSEQGGGTA